ncbi:hypothetical protein MCX33_12215 [Methylorubrum extorquens]|nr:hypothetical protein [Methylorubrum extorquens]MCG5246716.1 hypothetical protein [Methylorubrum extorquens]
MADLVLENGEGIEPVAGRGRNTGRIVEPIAERMLTEREVGVLHAAVRVIPLAGLQDGGVFPPSPVPGPLRAAVGKGAADIADPDRDIERALDLDVLAPSVGSRLCRREDQTSLPPGQPHRVFIGPGDRDFRHIFILRAIRAAAGSLRCSAAVGQL